MRNRMTTALMGLATASLALAVVAGTNEGAYEVLENGAGKFKLEIEGAPVASANVESITMEDLLIDEREMTTGADWDFRVFGPGDAHYGSITIRSRVGKESKELYQWWLDTSRGGNLRKTISVICLDRNREAARTYTFWDCLPTCWDPGEYSPSSKVAVETIVCKIGYVELQGVDFGPGTEPEAKPAHGKEKDGDIELKDFYLLYYRASPDGTGGAGTDVDSAWESCTGGGLCIEVSDSSTGSDQFHTTTPGHKYVDTLTLRGPLTAGRRALCTWINEVAAGVDSRRDIDLVEVPKRGEGRRFTYLDCFPTRYVFPSLSASGTGNLYEEVSFKPIRMELK